MQESRTSFDTQKPRPMCDYHGMMRLAQTKYAAAMDALAGLRSGFAAQGKDFGDAHSVELAADGERRRLQSEAARLILELVGKAPVEELRLAVAPEKLKSVLSRAGAGVDALMMIGEGTDELQQSIALRQCQIDELRGRKNDINEVAAAVLWSKLDRTEGKLHSLEQLTKWTKTQALQYRRLHQEFEEALINVRAAKK